MSPAPVPKSHPVTWLFLDVGGVLFDDAPLLNELYRYFTEALIKRGVEVTHTSVLAERERLIAEGAPGVYKAVLRRFTPNESVYREILSEFRKWLEPRQRELNPVRPGAGEALSQLVTRYRLAIAANQGAYLTDLLDELGWRHLFSSITLSGIIGISKPDPRFFERMLEDAGARHETSVMVGDSLANDLRPAHEFGLRTVRVIAGGDNVRDDSLFSFVDGTISSITELPGLLEKWEFGTNELD